MTALPHPKAAYSIYRQLRLFLSYERRESRIEKGIGASQEAYSRRAPKEDARALGEATCRNSLRAFLVLLGQSRHLFHAMLDFDDKGVPSRAEPQLHHTSIPR